MTWEKAVAFVRARLDEDEQRAKNADDFGEWGRQRHSPWGAIMLHQLAWSPGRVLLEAKAKRQILDWCAEIIGGRDLSTYGQPGCLADDRDALAVTLAVEAIRDMTTVYPDHPDYRPEWRDEVS